ncbi:hypothetical protein [Gryllotalpicola koreensis]|uniref:Uncharacterized protein n=1 Tax=Gryllotalpicola koreensis TaxID=993086 RepID=A0ABP8A2N9_9MICO
MAILLYILAAIGAMTVLFWTAVIALIVAGALIEPIQGRRVTRELNQIIANTHLD